MIEPIKIENIPKVEEEVLSLSDFIIDPDVVMPEPIPILSHYAYGRNTPIFTEDNISMIQGKAKSRKSTLLKALATAIGKGEFYMLRSNYHRNKIAIFDTEQGAYHCWRSANVIKLLSGRKVDYYKLKGTSTEQKKFIVEQHLKRNPMCGFIILDNIVHFLTDFNSSTESTDLNNWLFKMVSDYNCHICVVIHENGSDTGNGKAKGHIGTLLKNTCETIIRVEKDKDDRSRSIVRTDDMRGLEFDPFVIEMDYQGVPYLSDYDEPQPRSNKPYKI